MAYFAKINTDNVVEKTVFVRNELITADEIKTEEQKGIEHLQSMFGADKNFVQCSYNTHANKYYVEDETGYHVAAEELQSKKLRKNYPSPGWIWDSSRNCFYEPKRFDSWVFNEDTACYEAPVAYPSDDTKVYEWDEVNQEWIVV